MIRATCPDVRNLQALLEEGGVDHLLRLLIGHGLPPVLALRMATEAQR